MSTSGLAAAMGDEAPRNLYYHVHRLHSAGLIRLVRTEPRRGTVEKFYEAVAKVFTVKPELVVTMGDDQVMQDDVVSAARQLVEDTLHRFATSVARGLFSQSIDRIPPTVAGITVRASEDRLREIGDRLRRWVLDLSREDHERDLESDPEKPGNEYAGLVMFFPTELEPPTETTPPENSEKS
jgi:hypothetical protein